MEISSEAGIISEALLVYTYADTVIPATAQIAKIIINFTFIRGFFLN